MSESNGAYPGLRYRDADAAIDWLKRALDAKEESVHRDDGGVVRHAVIRVGHGLVLIGELTEDTFMGSRGFDPWRSPIGVYVVADDPDALHGKAVAAGAQVVRELEDTDYGSRDFSVRDPEGNLWSIGTYEPASGG